MIFSDIFYFTSICMENTNNAQKYLDVVLFRCYVHTYKAKKGSWSSCMGREWRPYQSQNWFVQARLSADTKWPLFILHHLVLAILYMCFSSMNIINALNFIEIRSPIDERNKSVPFELTWSSCLGRSRARMYVQLIPGTGSAGSTDFYSP